MTWSDMEIGYGNIWIPMTGICLWSPPAAGGRRARGGPPRATIAARRAPRWAGGCSRHPSRAPRGGGFVPRVAEDSFDAQAGLVALSVPDDPARRDGATVRFSGRGGRRSRGALPGHARVGRGGDRRLS